MPLYEYRCTSCGHTHEALQKMGSRPLRRCRRCPGKLERLVSKTSFHLKGGGWFNAGYAKGSPSPSPAKPESETKPAAKSSDSTSKPA